MCNNNSVYTLNEKNYFKFYIGLVKYISCED